MSVPKTEPAPRRNRTSAGATSRFSSLVAADIAFAAGDFTGGASEDLFTLSSHGFSDGDVVYVLWQSAMGGVTGGVGTRAIVDSKSSSTFQLTTDGTTVIENTADANVLFLRGNAVPQRVADAIINQIIVDDWDFTGGTVEDQGTPISTGMKGLVEGDTLKLLYKSAAGVTAGTVDTTYYAKSPTVSLHQIAATSGGSVIDSTADGTAVFLKTS